MPFCRGLEGRFGDRAKWPGNDSPDRSAINAWLAVQVRRGMLHLKAPLPI
ncbi:MAG: hypothetical protein MK108_17345 [Mariniblastus sp.]|nr:hypothetical protein [Mariniblastus sp.]